jgi:DNA polymerase-3 subunit alpha
VKGVQKFCHLHVHSEYSLLDGAVRIKLEEHHRKELAANPKAPVKSLVYQARALGMSEVALTDHGNMCGAVEFYREARSHGVKAILGMEAYVAPGSRTDRNGRQDEGWNHLTLLVKDERGMRNLIRLSSLGHEEGFYYRPRIDRDLLAKHSEGLIALSGCLEGEVTKLVLAGREEDAVRAAGWYKDLFGPDRFFLELMDHGLAEQKQAIRGLLALGSKTGLQAVATNDVHYLEKGDAFAHEVLLCIQTGKSLTDTSRMRFNAPEYYLKSPAEMAELFSEIPDAVTRSWEIGERCGLELVFADDKGGKLNFPPYPIPEGFPTADDYLRRLCEEGVAWRYGNAGPEVTGRLEHELVLIRQMGFATYFLIVGDIVGHAKKAGILVGPGRGSAAGSLVAYVLGITDLDPLKYGLIFERFLNPGRREPPDIDIDFPDNRRDEVVEYVREKFGRENVAQIVTFARMNARAVVRDVGRVMGLPYGEMDRLAKMIPGGPSSSLARGMETEEVKSALEQKNSYRELFGVARSLESLARHSSKHAAGVVIAPPTPAGEESGLRNFAPLLRLEEDVYVTQYDMDGVKHLGLLKIDLLGLKTLTVLDATRTLVRQTRGIEIDYQRIPLDDLKTFALFTEGRTDGIFQFESSGMRDALRKLKPDNLEDLIALNALYRPGPMEQIDPYIRRRRGLEPPVYEVPELEPILKQTYGIVVYQEQVIQIVHNLAGYTMANADDFRRSMGKKISEIMARERETFVAGAVKNGIGKANAERIFGFLEKFAGYGFNRSHSAAYALLAYWTAYLKTHHPVEFMAALLTSEMTSQDKMAEYVNECRKIKVPVLAPDVNASRTDFSVDKETGSIRFGLAAVKNVGRSATEAIVAEREKGGAYRSLYDFCDRVQGGALNKKVLESLIKCGAFDSTGAKREQLLMALGNALEGGARRQADREKGQEVMFAAASGSEEPLPEVDETLERNYLGYEKELLGCYVSGHPLAAYEEELKIFATASLKPDKLNESNGSGPIRIAGVVSRVKSGLTKLKKEPFLRFQVEDLEGAIEVLAWPEVVRKSGGHVSNGAILMLTGTLQNQEEGRPTMIARDMMPLEEARVRLTRAVHLNITTAGTEAGMLDTLRKISALSPGDAALYLHFKTMHHGEAILEASQSLKVRPTREMIEQLKGLLGDENVTLADRTLALG